MPRYLHDEVTREILAAYFAVYHHLGERRLGWSETALAQALAQEMEQRGLRVCREVAVVRRYGGRRVGVERVDLVVNGVVAVEVKRVSRLTRCHRAQLQAYLEDGGWAVGLLLNFGASKPDFRRLYERRHDPTVSTGEGDAE